MKSELILKKTRWNSEIEKLTKNLFFKFEWYNAVKNPWNLNVLMKAASGVMPLQINLLKATGYSGPWGSYGGPLGDEASCISLFESAIRMLKLRHLFLYRDKPLRFHSSRVNQINQITENTVILNLYDIETAEKNLHENRRRNLNKAFKENFYIKILKGREAARRYLRLYRTVKEERKEFRFHSEKIFKRMSELKDVFFFFAGKEYDIAAAVVLNLDGETLYFWHGLNTVESLNLHAGDFVQWNTITFGIENQFKFYNLGTSPDPDLLKYKLSWGGSRREVFIYYL